MTPLIEADYGKVVSVRRKVRAVKQLVSEYDATFTKAAANPVYIQSAIAAVKQLKATVVPVSPVAIAVNPNSLTMDPRVAAALARSNSCGYQLASNLTWFRAYDSTTSLLRLAVGMYMCLRRIGLTQDELSAATVAAPVCGNAGASLLKDSAGLTITRPYLPSGMGAALSSIMTELNSIEAAIQATRDAFVSRIK